MTTTDKNSIKKPVQSKGLGRGLGSLLGKSSGTSTFGDSFSENFSEDTSEKEISIAEVKTSSMQIERHNKSSKNNKDEDRILYLDIKKVHPDPQQPRKYFDKVKLEELSNSIREQGILSPIIVREKDNSYVIVAGERRWRAANLAGLKIVPVLLKKIEEGKALELAIIENVQRHDLNPIEEALAYQALIQNHEMTQSSVAEKVGKERSSIANALRLLLLPTEVVKKLSEGSISVGHSKVLLSLGDSKVQITVAEKIEKENLSVRATEQVVKQELAKLKLTEKALSGKSESPDEDPASFKKRLLDQVVGEIQKVLGSKVKIDYRNGKGKISLHFYSDEQLNQIIEQMKSAWKK